MRRLTITTWNINSIRLRLPLLEKIRATIDPDVICLQETKVTNDQFPLAACQSLGYEHCAFIGQKSYNGVAVLSKVPLEQIEVKDWCDRRDARHIKVILNGDIELHNIYVPAGGDIPDPLVNDKFAHKLSFVKSQTDWWQQRNLSAHRSILVGDLNIAPLPTDVWSHRQLLNVVSHTPIEVDHFNAWQEKGAWVDTLRHFIQPEEKLFSWWSYRNHDWKKSNRGRRLDHIWTSPALKPYLASASILKDARDWETPSDHVPVSLTLEF